MTIDQRNKKFLKHANTIVTNLLDSRNEYWQDYLDMKDSHSVDVPIWFLEMCGGLEELLKELE